MHCRRARDRWRLALSIPSEAITAGSVQLDTGLVVKDANRPSRIVGECLALGTAVDRTAGQAMILSQLVVCELGHFAGNGICVGAESPVPA